MPFYENVFIVRQDIPAAQVETMADAFTAILSENGGTVTKREVWGLRSLAYRIRKNRKGHYVLLNIDASSAAVTEMERNMGINEDVLRYLTVRLEELEEGPSAMLLSRQRDRDGPREGFREGGREGFGGGGREGFGGGGRDRDDRGRRERDDRGRRPTPDQGAAPTEGGTQ
jgi:small subunit ribosomal protein S6